jgi:hypothetical protein
VKIRAVDLWDHITESRGDVTGMVSIDSCSSRSCQIGAYTSDNLNTTQTPECTKEKYNAKIKVKGSLLRSHQQPTQAEG